ncbi:hypothetical protein B0O99DRAFT_106910 [Bisporella sp. PMI_857]|nr:hypothetical protein B0O99DRAFT_106910 [Bisporella sp. PMI_857]
MTVNVSTLISEELPYGYTGYGGIKLLDGMAASQEFAEIVNAYNSREPIIANFFSCAGSCSRTIKAAELAINCSEYDRVFDNIDYSVGNWDLPNAIDPSFDYSYVNTSDTHDVIF